ncbi:hypothetical protein LL033_14335 [Clostridium estertheticum]|uniref:hypothetical protein n=1 Tax=Clostridium estertheticum TaxID=238834 RepID=UPI001C0C9B02|nr:hypothetical protein [Clostridium estertheticum]MBU3213955.1 hypothetical protein [Clostridium estertheticum]WAG53831.1 hypothetical protein LL033_14335 [Clostridium estertheticum]
MNYIKKDIVVNKIFFYILLFVVYILDNAAFVVLKATSQKSSMIIGLVSCIFIFIIIGEKKVFTINKRYFTIIICLLIVISLQFIFSSVIFANVDMQRFISSCLLMIIVLAIAPLFADFMELVDEISFNEVINFAYCFMTTIGVISLLLIKFNLVNNKSMIIFSEPSHFAFVYLPFLLYRAYSATKNKRLLSILVGLILAIEIENLTLLVGICLIIILVYWKKKRMAITIICIGFIVINIAGVDKIAYFTDRLQITSQTSNISALVWLSGWERAYLSFFDSYGLGVGFQQMGIIGQIGKYMNYLSGIIGGEYLNMFDGGSTGAKIIDELGVLGVMLIVVYLIYFFRIMKSFVTNKVSSNIELFLLSVYIMFSIQLFVRGIGYFSPSAFMFFVSIYWIAFKRNLVKKAINK